VPLNFLTPRYDLPVIPVNINCQGPPLIPLKRCYEFGRALRRACDRAPERIALVGTGGISHWPATPDSGKINEQWDRAFLERFLNGKRDEMLAYNDDDTWRSARSLRFPVRRKAARASCGSMHPFQFSRSAARSG
jgi:aromatic ring-opening dioxygenase catalytic subunit (LigB family)